MRQRSKGQHLQQEWPRDPVAVIRAVGDPSGKQRPSESGELTDMRHPMARSFILGCYASRPLCSIVAAAAMIG
jgi:hypothetical protein